MIFSAEFTKTHSLRLFFRRFCPLGSDFPFVIVSLFSLFSIQLAAELDRSTTAELLIEEGAPAGVYDDNNLAALVVMIEKMPSVVRALNLLQMLDYYS